MSDLLSIAGLPDGAFEEILALAERTDLGAPLAGKGVALVFQKPSARTRNSTEMAAVQLGAHPVYIQKEEVGLGMRESAEDVARTLACYHAIIAARVSDHRDLIAMAEAVETPVLNLLSDTDHPLQALADLLTVKQLLGRLEGARIAYVGDADNNVARSLAQGCVAAGAELTLASPDAYQLKDAPYGVRHVIDPAEAVAGAQIVYTDVWVSMGQADQAEQRLNDLAAYQVNAALMAKAKDAFFLHCLPAHRGEEVSEGVLEGKQSRVWDEAENRLHAQKALMAMLMQRDVEGSR